MASFEEDAVRVEKPGVPVLPLGDVGVQRWQGHDVKVLEPPKVDSVGQDVNPFSALNSQISETKVSQAQAADLAMEDQEKMGKEQDLVKKELESSTEKHEEKGVKEMDLVEVDEGHNDKQEKTGMNMEEHAEVKEKKEKKEKKADDKDKKENKEKKPDDEDKKEEKKEKKEKKDKYDVDTLNKKLEKMNEKIKRILAKKEQYEQQLKEAKERQLQRAETQPVPST